MHSKPQNRCHLPNVIDCAGVLQTGVFFARRGTQVAAAAAVAAGGGGGVRLQLRSTMRSPSNRDVGSSQIAVEKQVIESS